MKLGTVLATFPESTCDLPAAIKAQRGKEGKDFILSWSLQAHLIIFLVSIGGFRSSSKGSLSAS